MNRAPIDEIKARIRQRNYLFTLHAGDRMTERRISVKEFEEAILSEAVVAIEDYPEDARGPSCLLFGTTRTGRPLHMHCTYPPDIAVITVYEPRPEEWINWKTRAGGKK